MNVNMITCGGQATIPMVAAVSRAATGVATPRSSRRSRRMSAGPGTRANIDEFTRTTAAGVRDDRRRRAGQGDHHPQPRRAADDHARHDLLRGRRRTRTATRSSQSVVAMEAAVQEYVPGYRLLQEPQLDDPSPATRGADEGGDLRRGRGRRRLPAAVLRQPRHHDRRRHPGRARTSPRQRASRMSDLDRTELDTWPSTSAPTSNRPGGRPGPPAHRHLPARRLAPQAAPVHRPGGATTSSRRSTTPASRSSR